MPPSASGLAQTRYEQARQGIKEDVTNWHSRLHTLFIRAYPQTYANGDETSLIRHFMMGCYRPTVRDHVQRAAPNTYNEALLAAQREQSVVDNKRQLDEVSPMEINAVDVSTAKCFLCGKIGHLKATCRSGATGGGPLAKEVNAMARGVNGPPGGKKPFGPWQKRKPQQAGAGVTLKNKTGNRWRFTRQNIQEMLDALDGAGEDGGDIEEVDVEDLGVEEVPNVPREEQDDDGNPAIQSIAGGLSF